MKKVLIIIIGITAVFLIGYFFVFKNNSQPVSHLEEVVIPQPSLPEEKSTTIYFVGDIMLARSVKTSVIKNFGGDYNKLFANMGELKSADILFANLEGDVSDKGHNVGSRFSFRMDPVVIPVLKDAGFDIVSFANNHVGDWSLEAFKDTLARLSASNLLFTGAGMGKESAQTPTIIEKNGIKFGFIGFSDVGPEWIKAGGDSAGILLASDPNFATIISNAKKQVDVLIVSVHWGIEYKKVHNVRQEDLAHIAIDSGADMVIGHHPHVMEDVEIYKDKPIVYSLGNFIFDQYFSTDTMQGMLYEATFSGKNLVDKKQKIVHLNKFYQPYEIVDRVENVAGKE